MVLLIRLPLPPPTFEHSEPRTMYSSPVESRVGVPPETPTFRSSLFKVPAEQTQPKEPSDVDYITCLQLKKATRGGETKRS